jgi:hypothetical protein
MEKVQTLLAKANAGAKIKDSEWLPWQRGPQDPAKWRHEETETEVTLRIRYLEAIGKDESDANPPEDSEGNQVHPMFVSDEHDSSGEYCGDCGSEIWEPCEEDSDDN